MCGLSVRSGSAKGQATCQKKNILLIFILYFFCHASCSADRRQFILYFFIICLLTSLARTPHPSAPAVQTLVLLFCGASFLYFLHPFRRRCPNILIKLHTGSVSGLRVQRCRRADFLAISPATAPHRTFLIALCPAGGYCTPLHFIDFQTFKEFNKNARCCSLFCFSLKIRKLINLFKVLL